MNKQELVVVSHDNIAKNIYELVVEGDLVADMREPGQFVHIKVGRGTDPLLRRPISICDVDVEKKRLTMIYRTEGRGTQLLAEAVPGESVDVLGPLGTGFPVSETAPGETAVLVGGGIGVPPLYYLSKQLTARGVRVIHVIGFASAQDVFYADRFTELGDVHVATVDGSLGTKGFVTDVLEQEKIEFDTLYACGPSQMLKALEERYRDKKGFLSLEQRMGCGVGACLACVCRLQEDPSGAKYRKICTDGPVFPIGEVIL